MDKEEAKRAEKCIDAYLDRLDFSGMLHGEAAAAARSVTKGFIYLDSNHAELKPEVMTDGSSTFNLTLSGFTSEVDLKTTYESFLCDSTRSSGYAYITGLTWNPGTGTITATIDPNLRGKALALSAPRRGPRISAVGIKDHSRSRQGRGDESVGGMHASVRVDASQRLDLSKVQEAHLATVAEAGIGVLFYDTVMPTMHKKPLVVPVDQMYKLIFFDMNKEFDVRILYRRMLGSTGYRDDFFGNVRSVGLEPRNKTLVMRIGMRQKVAEIR